MDVGTAANLGVAAFAIYLMFRQSERSSKQLDERELALRAIEKEVRDKVMEQLNKNTKAFEQVLAHFGDK